MKKILIIIGVFLSIAALSSCTKAVSSSASAPAPVNQELTSTVSPVQSMTTPAVSPPNISPIQSALPLNVTAPADASDINGNTVTVIGQTAPRATVTIGDQSTIADTNGNFSVSINLADGTNAIDVIASDDSGNQGEVLLMVNAIPSSSSTPTSNSTSASKGTLPLKVTSPADAATINANNVTIEGQTSPGATVTVNSETDVTDSNGNFSINVSLDAGANALDVIATDDNGNQGEVLLMVNVAGQ